MVCLVSEMLKRYEIKVAKKGRKREGLEMKPLLKQQSIKGRGLAVHMIESPKSLDAGSIPSPRALIQPLTQRMRLLNCWIV